MQSFTGQHITARKLHFVESIRVTEPSLIHSYLVHKIIWSKVQVALSLIGAQCTVLTPKADLESQIQVPLVSGWAFSFVSHHCSDHTQVYK